MKCWFPTGGKCVMCSCCFLTASMCNSSDPAFQYTDFDIGVRAFHPQKQQNFSFFKFNPKSETETSKQRVDRFLQRFFHGRERPKIWRQRNVFLPQRKKEFSRLIYLKQAFGHDKVLIYSKQKLTISSGQKFRVSDWVKAFDDPWNEDAEGGTVLLLGGAHFRQCSQFINSSWCRSSSFILTLKFWIIVQTVWPV